MVLGGRSNPVTDLVCICVGLWRHCEGGNRPRGGSVGRRLKLVQEGEGGAGGRLE